MLPPLIPLVRGNQGAEPAEITASTQRRAGRLNPRPDCKGWSGLLSLVCETEQTRVFAPPIILSRGRARKASSYHLKVNMGSTKKPGNESNKSTLARIIKEMAQPRIAKSRERADEPDTTRSGRVITVSRSHFLKRSRLCRPMTFSRLSLVSALFNRIE